MYSDPQQEIDEKSGVVFEEETGVFLGEIGEMEGAPTGEIEISCESCGAKVVLEPLLRTARCPYCDSPSVVDRPATADRPDPVFVIGFAVDRNQAARLMREFIGRKKLARYGDEFLALMKE